MAVITVKSNKKPKEWEHDPDYIRYVESGESAAVFVVRDVVKAVNTRGKWIDIVSLSAHIQDEDGWAFNWIVAELFPRKTQPDYSRCITDEDKKYLTWKTAHNDISQQRQEGYKGPKYLVLCTLHDKNKGRTIITYKLVKIIKEYRADDGQTKQVVQEVKKKKPETITEPCQHDWEYRINFLTRLKDSKAEFIREHSAELELKISAQGKSSPEIFGFSRKKGVNDGK